MQTKIWLVVIWLMILTVSGFTQEMTWEEASRGNHHLQTILVNPKDDRMILSGSDGNLIKSLDGGKSWRVVLTIRGSRRKINALAINPYDHNLVYAATDNGIYQSPDAGNHWNQVFKGLNTLENSCLSVLDNGSRLFVGTCKGLFISKDNGKSWYKENTIVGNAVVLSLDFSRINPLIIYLAATRGIFKSLDNGQSWEKVSSGYLRQETQAPEIADQADQSEESSDLRSVRAGINNVNLVYFSCAQGIYKSLTQGKDWEKLATYGLADPDIKRFRLSGDSGIYALSQKGLFYFENGHWSEFTRGLSTGRLYDLDLVSLNNVYLAADKGIFIGRHKSIPHSLSESPIQNYLRSEPKIKDLQQAAIKYAEVSPEKIIQWRKSASIKAILPSLNVGLDRNSTDLWHWEGGSTTKADDDTLRKGNDSLDWGLTLSWDLSDLIWSEAQTSIDVRSKLMVELRDDILDQVNKLYFERLRVKAELNNLAFEDEGKRFEKLLKIEELTASLDALTAGYYSEQLHKIELKEQG